MKIENEIHAKSLVILFQSRPPSFLSDRPSQNQISMLDDVRPTLSKSPIISAPFRRQLFEPCESSVCRPIISRSFYAPDEGDSEARERPKNAQGEELFSIREVRFLIEEQLNLAEEQIREKYTKELTAELALSLSRQIDTENQQKADDDVPDEISKYIYS